MLFESCRLVWTPPSFLLLFLTAPGSKNHCEATNYSHIQCGCTASSLSEEEQEIRTKQTRITKPHSRHCFGLVANSAQKGRSTVHSPGAAQLLRARVTDPLKSSSDILHSAPKLWSPTETRESRGHARCKCDDCFLFASPHLEAQLCGSRWASSCRCKAGQTHRRDCASGPHTRSCTHHTDG